MSIPSKWKHFNFNGVVNWFPGHMAKTSRVISNALPNLDLVLEVRDARIPLSSSNSAIDELLNKRPHLQRMVVFNKADLANHRTFKKIEHIFKDKGIQTYFLSTVTKSGSTSIKNFVPKVIKWIECKKKNSSREPYLVMIMGVPNVGKSSIINHLRERAKVKSRGKEKFQSTARTGQKAGVTRDITSFDAWEV